MYDKTLFHGTETKRGESILESQAMFISRGDKHWLGDGSYFYEDDFYAYKWIKDLYKNRIKKDPLPLENVFLEYIILKSKVKTNLDRIFDLDRPRIKMEFDRVYANCKNLQQYSKRFSKMDMPEGVVLNIMFEDMGYSKEYDVVIATFMRRKGKYKEMQMRLNFMPEKQICIKKPHITSNIEIYKCKDKIKDFEYCISNLDIIDDLKPIVNNPRVLTYNYKRQRYGKKS